MWTYFEETLFWKTAQRVRESAGGSFDWKYLSSPVFQTPLTIQHWFTITYILAAVIVVTILIKIVIKSCEHGLRYIIDQTTMIAKFLIRIDINRWIRPMFKIKMFVWTVKFNKDIYCHCHICYNEVIRERLRTIPLWIHDMMTPSQEWNDNEWMLALKRRSVPRNPRQLRCHNCQNCILLPK